MGTMNKMRENTGVVLWILVISFGVLWVLQDSGVFDTLGGQAVNKLIVVDGDPISYDEYNRALDQQIEQYRQQTGEPMTPQRMELEQDRVFDLLVENKLREQEMNRLGITVSDEEVREMVLGPDPHPIIKVYFGDGQGNVDPALLQNFIDDPAARDQWIQLEEYLRNERRRQKLDNLITSTVRVTDKDIEQEYRMRNATADAQYFALRYADIPDDSVTVSESDLERYYNEHRDDFERKRAYSIKVASYSKQASSADTTATLEDVAKLKETFQNTENDSLFLARYASEQPYSSAFFSRGDLAEPIADAVFANPEPGTIVGPILAGNEVHLIKIVETRPAEETNVRARHILIQADEDDPAGRAEARAEAEALKQRLADGEDFATLARTHSEDRGSGARGGDLGWFGPGRMVAPFQEAAFDAPTGRVVGPVSTEFGWHLIEVTGRANTEVRIADYAQPLRASTATIQNAQEKLEDLQYYTEEEGNFEQQAQRMDLPLDSMQVEAEQRNIPGIGNSRSLMQFLAGASVGDISDVIELDDQFIVAKVTDIQPEGYRPLAEVEDQVRSLATVEAKKDIQRQRLEQAYASGGFDGLTEALNTSPRTANGVSFSNPLVPSLGRSAIFAGTIMGLEPGEDSGVVDGENAVFVAKLINVNEPPPITEQQRETLRNELVNRQRSQVQTQWIASLKEQADIDDNRNQLIQ